MKIGFLQGSLILYSHLQEDLDKDCFVQQQRLVLPQIMIQEWYSSDFFLLSCWRGATQQAVHIKRVIRIVRQGL